MIALHPRTVGRLLPALFIALLTACASSPPEPVVDYNRSYDFSGVKTVAFNRNRSGAGDVGAVAYMSDMQINRINLALERAVQEKGLTIVDDPNKADALIAWHLVTEEKTQVRTYDTGPSYGGGYGRYGRYNRSAAYHCWNCGTDVRVSQYTQGTFIVDLVDPRLNQSVWRSITQSRLKGEMSQEQEAYDAAANRIMGSYPPAY